MPQVWSGIAPVGMETAKLFSIGTDTVVANGTASSVVAGTNNEAFYTITWSSTVASGTYWLILFADDVALAQETVTVSGDNVTTVVSEGSSAITVLPLAGVQQDRTVGTTISLFVGESASVSIAVVDSTGAAVDLSGMVLTIVFEDRAGADIAQIDDGEISVSSSTVSFSVPSVVTESPRSLLWSLRSEDFLLLHGTCEVAYAPQVDA